MDIVVLSVTWLLQAQGLQPDWEGSNPSSSDKLGDPGQVTYPLCASVVSLVKGGQR